MRLRRRGGAALLVAARRVLPPRTTAGRPDAQRLGDAAAAATLSNDPEKLSSGDRRRKCAIAALGAPGRCRQAAGRLQRSSAGPDNGDVTAAGGDTDDLRWRGWRRCAAAPGRARN